MIQNNVSLLTKNFHGRNADPPNPFDRHSHCLHRHDLSVFASHTPYRNKNNGCNSSLDNSPVDICCSLLLLPVPFFFFFSAGVRSWRNTRKSSPPSFSQGEDWLLPLSTRELPGRQFGTRTVVVHTKHRPLGTFSHGQLREHQRAHENSR